MEPFLDQPVIYWPHGATASQIASTKIWPPSIAVLGYAPCIRAWKPVKDTYEPVEQLRDLDGVRHSICAFQDKVLIAADASADSRICVWDVATWQRQQVVRAGAEATSLAADREFLAVGTSAGYVRVWRKSAAGEYQILFDPDLQLDALPIYNVLLGRAPDNSALLVVQSIGKNGRLGVWRLTTGRLVHVIGCPLPPGDAIAAVAANARFTFLVDTTFAAVSWLAGHDPLVQLVNVLSKDGGIVDAGDMLVGLQEPACADFDGALLAVGFSNGSLCGFGKAPWTRHLGAAVGAVKCLPHRGQVLSGSADGILHLWSIDGTMLARVPLSFAPYCLSAGDAHVAVGGTRGEVQLLTLAGDDHVSSTQRPTEQQRQAALEGQRRDGADAGVVQQYDVLFDMRGATEASSAAPQQQQQQQSTSGRAADSPEAFARFVRPRQYITPEAAAAAAAAAAAIAANGGGGSDVCGVGERGGAELANGGGGGQSGGKAEEEAKSATAAVAAEASLQRVDSDGATGGSSSSSKFDMRAALKGVAPATPDNAAAVSAAAEAAKRLELRQMGEDSGVARSGATVELESSTARLGRKCDNPTCLARQGLGSGGAAFKRCGACRRTLYCSAHCQRTAWRDGHAAECAQLAAASAAAAPAPLSQQQQQALSGPTAPQERASGLCEMD